MLIVNIILVAVLSFLIGVFLPSNWNALKKYTVAIVLTFSFNTVLGYIFLVTRVQINSNVFSIIFIGLILLLLYEIFIRQKKKFSDLYTWHTADTAILISTILLSIILIFPTFKLKGDNIGVGIPPGGDMSNHFFVVNMISQKGTYTYFDENLAKILPVGLVDYPQASHYNFSVLTGGSKENITTSLLYFRYYYAFCFILFFSVFLNASVDILSRKTISRFGLFIVCSLGLVLFTSTLFASTYLSGFISQFVGLLALIVLVFCISKESFYEKRIYWAVSIILLNAFIAGAWYFLTPIALVVSYLAIFRSSYRRSILIYVLTLLLVLPPIAASISGNSASTINASGLIDAVPFAYIAVFIASTIFTLWNIRLIKSSEVRPWLELLLVSAFFSSLVAAFQIKTSGQVSYYFLKAIYTPIMILAIFFCVSIVLLVHYLRLHFPAKLRFVYIYSVTMVLLSVGFILVYRPETSNLGYGLLLRANYFNNEDFSRLSTLAEAARNRNKSTVLINTGSSLNDYVYSKWISAQNLNYTKEYGDLLLSDLILADKLRRTGKSEVLTSNDIILPNNSIEVVDFRTGSVER